MPPRGDLMKAVVYCDYGSPDVLRYEDVEKPVPGDDEVLVRVRAAALNPLDWHTMRGTPYFARIGMGLRKPKVIRLGVDFAGTVEAVGRNVTRFKPGDEVLGGRTGALAEYVSVRADRAVVLKLHGVETIEDAAKLRDALVEVPEEEAVKLPPNHYFWHQIIGLQVVTVDGAVLGKIDEILETGSNDVYVIHGPGGELLIPAIKQVVKSVDLNSGTMTVELMPELE
jgi:16S rRNA processing protein RimM